MPTLAQAHVKLLESFKVLLTGPSGVGKSIAAAEFYKMGKVHFSDFDGRMKPIVNHYKNIPEAMANISYESYHSVNYHDFLVWMDVVQQDGPKFKTWVLDSVTSASNAVVMYQLWKKDKIKTNKAGLPVTGWDEINAETVGFTQLLEAGNYLNERYGTNIIWIAHPVSKTIIDAEDQTKSKKYESIASYGHKIPSLIPTKFDEIYRLDIEKIGADKYRRIAHTSLLSEGQVVAKTALDLPPKMDVSNGLYSAMIANLKKEEEVKA